jgi:hypothetical protein
MKTSSFNITLSAFVLAVLFSTNFLHAQTTALPVSASNNSQPALQKGTYQVTERGANHRIWQRVDYETTPDGRIVPHIHKYTELATGMHYQKNGQWVESKEQIDILPDGTAAATQGQHQVYFPGDIAQGVITLNTPDGLKLQSRPIALSFEDANSNIVLIAILTNSIGYLAGSNQVIYPNAFEGITASVRCRYTKAGFEQDIVLEGRPPSPESFGLNPQTARLQVLTEFFNPPVPHVVTATVTTAAGDLTDQKLDFGVMEMRPGKAFLLGTNTPSARVYKHWLGVDGRQFLVEEVPVRSLAHQLLQLPSSPPASTRISPDSPLHVVSARRLVPPQHWVKTGPDKQPKMQIAQAAVPVQGLVLDYQTVNNNLPDYTFQGDTTYLVSGPVYLNGVITFEGGAVIKYLPLNTWDDWSGASLNVAGSGSIQMLAAPYRPVIFTGSDDTSVGEDVGACGGPYQAFYANPAISYDGPMLTLRNFRIAYANTAISATSAGLLADLENGQILQCNVGFETEGQGHLVLKNMLFADFNTALLLNEVFVYTEYVTFVGDPYGWRWWGTALARDSEDESQFQYNIDFVNCILADISAVAVGTAITVTGDHNGFYNTCGHTFGTSITNATSNPFQTAGVGDYAYAGYFYLTDGCPFRNAGCYYDPGLLVSLVQKTTHPPIFFSNITITNNITLGPQAQRDTNTAAPDLGYHYDPIDYITSGVTITNATLTITNGTAIACYNETGIKLLNGSAIISQGSALAPNWFTRYSSVQDHVVYNWLPSPASALNLSQYHSGGAGPSGTFQFSKFSCSAGGGSHLYDNGAASYSSLLLRDCEFWGGQNDLTGSTNTTVILNNNLFYRSPITASAVNLPCTLALSNNLMLKTTVTLLQPSNAVWYAFNNDFDSCSITNNTLNNGYNAYLNCSGRLYLTNAHDIVTSSLAYQSSWLGDFYQPTNSPLIDHGSTTADQIGLYHYTTQTNQTKEAFSVVDIGYHYVAVDANGNPIDSHGAGIPDYIADANGNGLVDNGETPWLAPPVITVQPTNQTVYTGSNAVFSVTATNQLPLTYQWRFNGTGIPGATNTSLLLTNVQYAQAGNYSVIVTNTAGVVISSTAVLTVRGNIIITQQPLTQEVQDGDMVTFAVETVGDTNLTYQWTSNSIAIPGATNSSYTINYVDYVPGDESSNEMIYSGDYAVTISNGRDSITSTNATLWRFDMSSLCTPPSMIMVGWQRQNYTFKSGVTYYVPIPVILYGQTTIEPGAVIKLDYYAYWSPQPGSLLIEGTLHCKGEPYYPAFLTSVDDDSVGQQLLYPYDVDDWGNLEPFSWWDGPPQPYATGWAYLDLFDAESSSVNNLRISYADYGVSTPVASQKLDVWNCQFVQCNYGVVNLAGDIATNSLHNVLFSKCWAAVGASTDSVPVIEAEQITADVTNFCVASSGQPSRIAITNSIIWGNSVTASNLSTLDVVFNPGLINFQSMGGANYYLAANSPLHAAGTANISSCLLTELQSRTTYAPIAIASNFQTSGQITLSAQTPRYTNGAPDLGYYYDALDYTIADMILLQGGSITILPGTAIGFRNEPSSARGGTTSWGIDLREGSSFVSHGTPNKPIIYSDVQFVQEQTPLPCTVFFTPDFEAPGSGVPAPVLDFQFCDVYAPCCGLTMEGFIWSGYIIWAGFDEWNYYAGSPDSLVNWNMRDCALHGGKIHLGPPPYYWIVFGSGQVNWMNNLFDRVNIYLEPTYYWYNQTTNCDMQVQAFNNIFRESQWFFVNPNPASAGNWVFKDNLFDRVNFYQKVDEPLDADNNAYWPPTAPDLYTMNYYLDFWFYWYGNSAQLTPTVSGGGTHEVTLAAAPPYQSGPLGDYYLPTNTPLYNAGSTNAGALGLYHYTTRLDQVKEGNEPAGHMVNIGLHYIAVTNGVPIDSDSDGIADYVENWHGDGDTGPNRIHTADETDWQNPMTDGVTNDAYNAVYDNVDLDGDGLTGAAERFFGTNPLLPDNPLNMSALPQQSTLTGIVQIPLNFSSNVNTNTTFTLLVNGIAQYTTVYQTNGNWFAGWDTTAFANDQYQLSMEYDLDEDTPVIGATKFVNVQNDICFPNSLPICGGSLYVQPQTININGTYAMEVYDDQTNLFASLSGSVDGNGFCLDPNTGQPGITVSLLDTNGNQWPSEYFTVQVTTYPVLELAQSKSLFQANQSGGGGSSGSTGTRRVFYSQPWSGHRWVIAFMALYGDPEFGNESALELAGMMEGAAEMVHGSSYGQNDNGVVNDNYPTEGLPYWISLDGSSQWNQVRGLLSDGRSENFFYFGHGATDFIGVKSGNKIASTNLVAILTNNLVSGIQTLYGPQKHPYRFVFLDGCDTAKGNLPMSFGIPNQPVLENDWDNKYFLQPRAFLGWSSGTGQSVKSQMPGDHLNFIVNFWNAWGGNDNAQLQDSLTVAALNPANNQRFTELDHRITLYGDPTLPFYQ